MIDYLTLEQIKKHNGLRIVLVKGLPSPWGQAAKTMFELKGLPYVAAPYVPFSANEAIHAWGGEDSAPLVAWRDEKPIHRWIDILNLAERLAPSPALIPSDAFQRAVMVGLSHELCGELGIGWNRRLQMFAPAMEAGDPPDGVRLLSGKYGYNSADAKAAGLRIAGSLRALSSQLEGQYERGRSFFVGDSLSALDIYWTAFMNLIDPLPKTQCPLPDEMRPGFTATDPTVLEALSPLLRQHRDTIFKQYFRDPMEF